MISALSQWRATHPGSNSFESEIRRGLVFLLRGRDSTGSWSSTQSTLRAMRAFADASAALGSFGGRGGTIEIRANGRIVKTIQLPHDTKATDPILVDLSPFLSSGENRISLSPSAEAQSLLIRLTSSHWIRWPQTTARRSPELRFEVQFDRLESRAGEPVRCSVKAQRVGFRGYGMMLAEIGSPRRGSRSLIPGTIDRFKLGRGVGSLRNPSG